MEEIENKTAKIKLVMGKECIVHKVKVDAHVSAEIMIPIEMEAIDLKALMTKANKLFNLAEVPIVEKTKIKQRKYNQISSEKEKEYVARWYKANNEERNQIAQELGYPSRKAATNKIQYLKKKHNIKTETRGRKSKWTSEETDKLKKTFKYES